MANLHERAKNTLRTLIFSDDKFDHKFSPENTTNTEKDIGVLS
jgi:hypothetical protein